MAHRTLTSGESSYGSCWPPLSELVSRTYGRFLGNLKQAIAQKNGFAIIRRYASAFT